MTLHHLTLPQLAAQPELLDDLPAPVLTAIIVHASAKLLEKSTAEAAEDRLITPVEASPIVGLSADYILHNRRLPFIRQPTGPNGRIKCSLRACREYVAKARRA